jgi:penicillin-binding protein-related factor A (putative recombinase)
VLIQRVDFKKEDEGKTKKLSDFASKQIKTFDKIRQQTAQRISFPIVLDGSPDKIFFLRRKALVKSLLYARWSSYLAHA